VSWPTWTAEEGRSAELRATTKREGGGQHSEDWEESPGSDRDGVSCTLVGWVLGDGASNVTDELQQLCNRAQARGRVHLGAERSFAG
jgi:hypothetical protein